ncbi:hypothetical protein BJX62DRAFT_222812 [Aspergillus germanicus]
MARHGQIALLVSFAILPLAVYLRLNSPLIFSRCFPDDPCWLGLDPCWPSVDAWEQLNALLAGHLISSEKCSELRTRWSIPVTQYEEPFLQAGDECTIGPLAHYTANVTSATDVQKVIEFTTRHNIRPSIRNTGDDYLGRSTAPSAVALWMHNLKFTEYRPEYTSSWYTGPALRIGAGVQGHEAQEAAHRAGQGYVIMSAHSPDVEIAGGYTQGGGYGPLASKYGLAADQVLEWEVVTAGAEILTASPEQNADLYWALSGGGGGTYGVVLGMTVRMHGEDQTASASLVFSFDPADTRAWDVIRAFISDTLPLVDAGGTALWVLYPGPTVEESVTFIARPLTLPGGTKEELQAYITSTVDLLSEYGIPYELTSETFPTYHASTTSAAYNVTEFHGGSLLIHRSAVDSNMDGFVSIMQSLLGSGAAVSGFSVNVSHPVVLPVANKAVTPTWRKAAISLIIGLPFNYTDRYENINHEILMTHVLVPKLADFARSTGEEVGAYMNEGDWDQRDWQSVLYGENYEHLLAIKDKYDPEHIFYSRTGVGSDRWGEDPDGRLHRA